MRALIQRVSHARVLVGERVVSEIGPGILTFLGVGPTDTAEDVEKLISKIAKIRIFEDESGKMNRSILETQGSHLIVSQFTLYGDVWQGNRPGFSNAAPPELARQLYEWALKKSAEIGLPTSAGEFGADMKIELTNVGPATFWLEV